MLDALAEEVMRFSKLNRRFGDISKQMLSQTLEQDGLVARTLFLEVPSRVEYRLTPLGRSFLKPMRNLVALG